jgi:hypothetical protein
VVFKAGHERPAVDIVELLGENPWIFCVVDLEAAVRRDACGGCQVSEEQEVSRKRVSKSEKGLGKE